MGNGPGKLLRRIRGIRSVRGRLAPGTPTAPPLPPPGDELAASPPLECTALEIQRWNAEWFEYLRREWDRQLEPYTAYPDKPPLPESARDLIHLTLGHGPALALYADRDAIEGRRILEMGCGCGNLGKLIARYADSYLGTDYSTLALKIARLVSPPNCAYVHVADRAGLAPFFGRIDTALGRYFWIHQNFQLARWNLEFLELFLAPGGRLYADFYWPNPAAEQGIVFTPDHPLSRAYPSATFRYSREDVERLIAGRPFRILREEISPEMQRRYVVLERLEPRGRPA
ncbi:MAG TPA: class I SAM-dependent methyltransferase [Thermoanaerobaculia bacterium]